MKIRLSFLVAIVLLLGILVPNFVFAQEGQPPYAPKAGKIWVWEPAHWTPTKAWYAGYPPPPPTTHKAPPKLRRYWKWIPGKWIMVKAHSEGPHEWKPAYWDPVKRKWIKGAWIKITIVPEGKVWISGTWDPVKRIWITGHWDVRIVPPPGPPVVKPPPPPPVVKPLPPEPIPPKPAFAPKPGFHWEWDPVIKNGFNGGTKRIAWYYKMQLKRVTQHFS